MDRASEFLFECMRKTNENCRKREQAEIKEDYEKEKAEIQNLIDQEELDTCCPECDRPLYEE